MKCPSKMLQNLEYVNIDQGIHQGKEKKFSTEWKTKKNHIMELLTLTMKKILKHFIKYKQHLISEEYNM